MTKIYNVSSPDTELRKAALAIAREILVCESEAQKIASRIENLNNQLDALFKGAHMKHASYEVKLSKQLNNEIKKNDQPPTKSIKVRIVELLELSDRSWTSDEIANELNENFETVASLVSRLVNKHKILSRPTPRSVAKMGWVPPG